MTDPVEERDVLKLLAMLEDPRIIAKLCKVLGAVDFKTRVEVHGTPSKIQITEDK